MSKPTATDDAKVDGNAARFALDDVCPVESEEVAPGVLDYDESGWVIGVELLDAHALMAAKSNTLA